MFKQNCLPKVSIVIPVYNAVSYIHRCLDSVCNQTLKDIEIICVDDCSTDNSLDILYEYAQNDDRIRVIKREQNGGESTARNTGLDIAQGEFLAFVDNDDALDLDLYEKLYNKAITENADIAKADVHIYQYNGEIVPSEINNKLESGDKFYFAYQWWTAIFRTSLIKDNNIRLLDGYPLGGDVFFLNNAVIRANKVSVVNDTFYHYYRREDSGDAKLLSFEKIKSVTDIFDMILDNFIELGIKSDGVAFSLSSWLTQTLEYPFRVNDIDVVRYILKFACKYYKKANNSMDFCKAPVSIIAFPAIVDMLKNEDIEALVAFYQKYNSIQKMVVGNIRYFHEKGLKK